MKDKIWIILLGIWDSCKYKYLFHNSEEKYLSPRYKITVVPAAKKIKRMNLSLKMQSLNDVMLMIITVF